MRFELKGTDRAGSNVTEDGLFTVCSLFYNALSTQSGYFSAFQNRAFHKPPFLADLYLNKAFLFTETFLSISVTHHKKRQSALFLCVFWPSKLTKSCFLTQLVGSLSCTSRKARSYKNDRKEARADYSAPAQHKVDLSYNSVSCIHPRKH